ncbi:MAG: hypothetical protein R2798_05125 [Chitinophagales bacterium]|nr:hypothetical protein [Bacteroidota bacterium]MCB9042702.1 hypothetical protein [Chitinophagales bacterium]
MKKYFYPLFILLSIMSYAQNDDVAAIEDVLQNVAKNISSLHETHNAQSVLKYFDINYVETEHRLYINQELQIIEEPYNDFKNMIDGYANTTGLVVNYRVTNFLKTVSKNNWGLTIAECEYDVTRNGVKEYSAREIQSISMLKKEGTWKIVLNQTTKFIDEVFKGDCLCEIFTSSSNNYVAKVTYPAGGELKDKLYSVGISALDSGRKQIVADEQYYTWNSNTSKTERIAMGNILSKNLGNASDQSSAILEVIKDLTNTHCAKVTLKK